MSEKRTLGKTGFEVSTVGMGCWQLGGCWTSSDDTAAHKLALHAYLDAGANLLDTANVYGGDPGTPTFGWSEKTIGEVLQERKAAGNTDRVYVCTKAGRAPTSAAPGDHGPERYTYEALSESLAASAARLQVDVDDLLPVHCPPTECFRAAPGEGMWAALEKLKAEGRILHWGVSVETVEEATLAIAIPTCATVQIIFNLLRHKPAETVLAAAAAANVGTLIRVPYASGLLTGKVTKEYVAGLDGGDHRVFNVAGAGFDKGETWSGLGEKLSEVALPAVDELKKVHAASAAAAAPFGQFSLRWILDHPGTTAVIPGARSVEQVKGNLGAMAVAPLGEATHKACAEVYEKLVKPVVHGSW